MKKIALAAAALALGTVSASAADMAARYTKAPVAVAAVYNWTGFYIGARRVASSETPTRCRVRSRAQ